MGFLCTGGRSRLFVLELARARAILCSLCTRDSVSVTSKSARITTNTSDGFRGFRLVRYAKFNDDSLNSGENTVSVWNPLFSKRSYSNLTIFAPFGPCNLLFLTSRRFHTLVVQRKTRQNVTSRLRNLFTVFSFYSYELPLFVLSPPGRNYTRNLKIRYVPFCTL